MSEATTIELDTAKHVYHTHGAAAAGRAVFSHRLTNGITALCLRSLFEHEYDFTELSVRRKVAVVLSQFTSPHGI